jgi:3-phenylpropionate/trans-cinnamate dioxygenase ferredoxin reductase component
MPQTDHFVIVGAGLAGAKTAEALRDQGYDGELTLVGTERHLPYERPPLSKDYLAGKAERSDFEVHDAGWYDEHKIALLLTTTATKVDPAAHTVGLSDGSTLTYTKLALATGSEPRVPPVPGLEASGVHYLRTVEDSDAIRAELSPHAQLVVIGGGWIGLEVAAAARAREATVSVVEAAELPLAGALGPEIAKSFLSLHRDHGVVFYLGATVAAVETEDEVVRAVVLADGTRLPADAVVVGVGAAPRLALADGAGLEIDNGVVVDESLQTSDPDIVAVGDIAQHAHPVLGQRVRVEHWANALNQPSTAAATMLGTPTPYTELPYFFTDQYDLGMEFVGHAPPGSYDHVLIRGDLDGREYIAFWLDADGRVLAGMNVNVWDVVDDIKALILTGQPVDEGRLADPDVPLSDLVADAS